ncbi:hypothetical protein MKK58_05815 [Methylobacterium sp. J-078]|uniref:hypothetical protein n=1 Tax=Methylobacterium sp. J-078 TaxID=2836657 RepID=UPI001FBBE806|nr:hypothetical protein [Methylobacterium sp. J-078]MCJ2044050.1 hypothetical protein [Methylobacterium sp. J-078]
MTAPALDDEGVFRPFDPAPLAAQVHTALDSYLRDRAPDQRLAFWKAVALGYGGNFESLAGFPRPLPSVSSP